MNFNNKKLELLEKFKKKPFFLSFFIVFILFLLSLSIFKSIWGMNDDVFMAMYASGKGFSNKPTEYIFFSNIIIGKSLQKLYQTIPNCPWYGFYTFFILFISHVALLYSLLNYRCSWNRLVYFLMYFSFFGLLLIITPEFTTNAFMLGMSGIFLFISGIYREKTSASSNIILVLSILFLTLSSLIRIDSFYLVVILSLPLILIEIIKGNFKKQAIKKSVIVFVSLLLIVPVCYLSNKMSYIKNDNWMRIIEKNKLVIEMVDNNKVTEYSPKTEYIFRDVGWTRNDFLLMGNWFFADDKIFSKEKMGKIFLGFKDIPMKRNIIHFKNMLRSKLFYGTVLFIIFLIIQMNEKKKSDLGIIVTIIASICMIIYLGYYKRLPARIYVPIFSFVSFLVLFFTNSDTGLKLIKEGIIKFKVLFIITFIIFFLFLGYMWNTSLQEKNAMIKERITGLHPKKNQIFLVWGNSLPLELLSVFDNLEDFSDFRMLTTGYHFNNPVSTEILKEFNVKTFGELIEKDNLYHIGNLKYMALYAQYLKEHYNLDVAFRIYMVNPMFMVYKHVKISSEITERLISVPVNVAGLKYTLFVIQE